LNQLVHTNKTVGDYINAHYICVKINGDSLEGKALRGTFKYPGYPTTIFLTPQGEEIDRIVGFSGNKDEYFQTMKDYTEGRNTLKDYLAKSEAEPENITYLYQIMRKYFDRNDFAAAKKYAEKLLAPGLKSELDQRTESEYILAHSQFKISEKIISLQEFVQRCSDKT